MLHAHWLHDEAAACYEIARGLAPEDFRWVYLLAGVEDVRGGDGERIDQLFTDAIRLSPRFPPAYVRRADALMRLGRWSEARESYAVAAELDPGLILAHRGRGQAAVRIGSRIRARAGPMLEIWGLCWGWCRLAGYPNPKVPKSQDPESPNNISMAVSYY